MADGNGGQMGFGFIDRLDAAAGLEPLTREQRRSRRKRPVRAKTISVKRLTKHELEMGRLLYPNADNGRPKTRAECPPPDDDGKRRCRFVSCAAHNYLSVNPKNGAIKLHFPDLDDPGEIPEPCSLDACDRGGLTLEQVGAIFNITRERVRQLEVSAVAKLAASGDPAAEALLEWAEADGLPGARGEKAPKRRLPLLQARPDAVDEPGPVDDLDDEHTDARGRSLFGRVPMPDWTAVVAAKALPPVSPTKPDVPFDRRERALLRMAERLGRFTAASLARACGMPGEEWAVASLVARGVIGKDGESYVWIGTGAATAAE